MATVSRFLPCDHVTARKEMLPMTIFEALVLMISFASLIVLIMKEK
ncbi:putative holin-like toxin [Heyndrickxia sporothermodurans]|uniref:Uncharacterized protein n=1 Tax=Heyndrickxia sporothermodurans TaxID=46224 RepID=A0A150KL55_9BACI|nr:putative holin-like toxin [Heyndrickxia sporothermodurans]KYC89939.1 hypothetical protein B4102_3946 [Heyndrickxia sporothermodurans]MBL5783052.1 hypothetical protein [Heyndrickxia sporothermodurans]MBL5794117.1 hypothetical protein [Heyndrickxia sporothermodurans]MBL5855129.1 hypothetical protein [Heyndrickxia sporothermodurans]MBL5867266.1 hypothetical protein [Heyndrickxia sporothermodurans]